MLVVEVDAHSISVEFDRFDSDCRAQYRYAIRDEAGAVLAEGDDLRSGVGDDANCADALVSLCSFLIACGESYPDGENADLFPPAAAQWAAAHADDLDLIALDLGAE